MVLRLRIPAPRLWEGAKCLGLYEVIHYDLFFEDPPEAVAFCNGEDGIICPIRHECLLFALTNNLKEGVWGGTVEATRRVIRARWPLEGREPRDEWHWMTHDEALHGARLEDLIVEEEEDEDE